MKVLEMNYQRFYSAFVAYITCLSRLVYFVLLKAYDEIDEWTFDWEAICVYKLSDARFYLVKF